MKNILKKYLFDTDNIFEDNYETKNNHTKNALSNLLNELPDISNYECVEIFNLMNSNSISTNFNTKEAYVVATSKIINGYAIKCNYMFAKCQKEISFYNSMYWENLDISLFLEFLKVSSNKIGIPECIASSVAFIKKLQKQFFESTRRESSNVWFAKFA